MMFSSLTVYRLGGATLDTLQFADMLSACALQPIAATAQKSVGWVPPRVEQGAFVECIDGQWIARFAIETKTVPAAALNKRVDEKVAAIECETGRAPGRKERRDLREDALLELLPHAFPRRVDIPVWIDPQSRWLVVGACGGKADEVVSALVSAGPQGLRVNMLNTSTAPQAAMTAWLGDAGDEPGAGLSIGRSCELRSCAEGAQRVRFDNHDLLTADVRKHVDEGKLPIRLAMASEDGAEFELTSLLTLKKIKLTGDVESDGNDDAFDADAALTTGTLRLLIQGLVRALGGYADEDSE